MPILWKENPIMTKSRANYLYHLEGSIQNKKPQKASPKSKYAGQLFYNLTVSLEDPHQHIKLIQVFKDKLANPEIWTAIEQGKEFQQKYHFSCRNQRGYYYLVDWEEVKHE